ncbi:MAG: PilZ domain-containing protein [Nitrospirota bacterium]|nr:PilZ domain-containing protein [Nitrospirota bacterium]
MRKLVEFLEKRLHPRYYLEAPMSFDIFNTDSASEIGGAHKATLADIGKKGCSFLVDRVMFRGFYLLGCLEDDGAHRIKLIFRSSGSEETTELFGRIAWIDNVSGTGDPKFKIGVEFHPAIEGSDLNKLLRSMVKPVMEHKGENVASL